MARADTTAPSAASWLRTGSLGFLLVLVGLSLLVAHLWTVWALPSFNSDHLGCDACHHAILIHCQSLPGPLMRAVMPDGLVGYPQTSHWLAARWMAVLDGDPYKAMRAVSAASVLLMFACQFCLLRRALPAGPALLALLAWQMVCYLTNLANTQYYCVAYFFSQGVGMTFVWGAIVLITWPTGATGTGGWQRGCLIALGAVLAGVAYLCHIVPGVAILGGLGLYFLVCWARARRWADLAGGALIAAVGLAVILGTTQLAHMSESRQVPGSVPLKNWSVLLAWVPTLLVALLVPGRRWLGKQQRLPVEELLEVLTCVLCVAGALQAYCAVEYWRGKSALYSVNKFFYVLFPVSSLMWVLAGASWLQRRERLGLGLSPRLLSNGPARFAKNLAAAAVVGLLLYLNGRVFVRSELLDEKVEAERHPVRCAQRLAHEAGLDGAADTLALSASPRLPSDLIYYDPCLPQSSVFVNVVGLRRSWSDVYGLNAALAGWRPGQVLPAEVRQRVNFRRLILPSSKSAVRARE
jgi:hypothetical protein